MSVRSVPVPVDDEADELRRVIGANVRLARRGAGMSQEDLIEAVDGLFVRQQLSTWENGHKQPRETTLARIGSVTGRSLAWFYEPHDDTPGG
jgi:transcriptional regulator with XRE-family HTH domain